MTLLFNSWVCDHCDPPNDKKKEADKTRKKEQQNDDDDGMFPLDDQWNGWNYADNRHQMPIGIAISEPDEYGIISMILLTDPTVYILINDIETGRFKKGKVAGRLIGINSNGSHVLHPYKEITN